MTHQQPLLPASDREFLLALAAAGSSAGVARIYGCDESAVRKRARRIREGTRPCREKI